MNTIFTYLLLDSARCGIEAVEEAELLVTGKPVSLFLEKNGGHILKTVAPYLFEMSDELQEWYLHHGWGKSWGIMIKTGLTPEQLNLHLKKFLKVKTERDKKMFFRFYDPRVLRLFLPTCDVKQLREFLVPAEQFLCEDEDSAFGLVFSFENNSLKTDRIPNEEIFSDAEKKNPGRKFFV